MKVLRQIARCAELDAVKLATGKDCGCRRVPAAEADAAVLFCGLGWMCEIAQMSQMPCYVQRPLPSEDGAPAQVAAPLAARVGRDGLLQWLEHLAHRPVSRTHMQPHIVGLRQTCIHARRCSYLRGPL